MTSNGFARPGRVPNEESFIDKVYTGICEPGREPPPGFYTMVKGANARTGMADRACASKASRDALARSLRYRDGIMRMTARHRPLRAAGKAVGRLISKRRFWA